MPKLRLQDRSRFLLHLCEQNYARNWVRFFDFCPVQQWFIELSFQWIDTHRSRRHLRSNFTTNRRSSLSKMWTSRSCLLPSTNTSRWRRDETLLCLHQPKLLASMDRVSWKIVEKIPLRIFCCSHWKILISIKRNINSTPEHIFIVI